MISMIWWWWWWWWQLWVYMFEKRKKRKKKFFFPFLIIRIRIFKKWMDGRKDTTLIASGFEFFFSFHFISLRFNILSSLVMVTMMVCVCVYNVCDGHIEIHALGNYRWRRWRLSSKMMMVEVVDGWLVGWIDDWSMVSWLVDSQIEMKYHNQFNLLKIRRHHLTNLYVCVFMSMWCVDDMMMWWWWWRWDRHFHLELLFNK